MSVIGIVAEYNPFHSGHEFLLNQARLVSENDPIIVMTVSYTHLRAHETM